MTPEEQKAHDELKKLYEETQAELARTKERLEEARRLDPPVAFGAMAPRSRHGEESHADAALDAAASGKRNDLLRYMRLRRKR